MGPLPETDGWDVIVIGTGMGGATIGHALAGKGRRVLFLERGDLWRQALQKERIGPTLPLTEVMRWPEPLAQVLDGQRRPVPHPLGHGAGGSSALYAMVMERFRPADFTPRRFHPQGAAAALPEAWPVSYDELAPFYAQAEDLYRVRGTADSLFDRAWTSRLPPPPPSEKEASYLEELAKCDLHPYRFHYACEQLPGCRGCRSMVCPRDCRNDAEKICLRPALAEFGASIAADCEAIKFEADGRRVHAVACRWQGAAVSFRAKLFVLAANALVSPLLLLRSANRHHPDGLANRSGLVGRNLMFHCSDHVMLRPRRRRRGSVRHMNHGIGLNDYYVAEGAKLGNIHAHPAGVGPGAVLESWRRKSSRRWAEKLSADDADRAVKSGRYDEAVAFTTIVEDLPYHGNRVLPAGLAGGIAYEYRIAPELRRRSEQLVELFRRGVASGFRTDMLSDVPQLNLAHPAGTCRFGDDPGTSVADKNNRAHDVDNLYIVDSSFFPSSGGLNPSLTIAANALRVAGQITRRF